MISPQKTGDGWTKEIASLVHVTECQCVAKHWPIPAVPQGTTAQVSQEAEVVAFGR
jgi:hypothetical protein